jgi:GAF domain-containing protein
MADQDRFVVALSEFAHTLTGNFAIGDVLHDLSVQVTQVLDASGAGVSLADEDGSFRFVTALNEATAAVEKLQEEEQQGPCVDAHRTGRPVLVADLRRHPARWPNLVPRALELGVTAVAGLPMHLNRVRLGALNLYHAHPRDWTHEDVAAAQVLANMATSYVAHASEVERQRRTAEQLEEALASRVIIEQAKGMIAAERKITVDQAFELLRGHARSATRHRRGGGRPRAAPVGTDGEDVTGGNVVLGRQ